jgi:hypothetical protein
MMAEKKPTAAEAEARLRAARDRALRARMGPALDWSDEALDGLSAVSEADEVAAARYWDRLCPKEARGLLDAEPVEDG